MLHAIDSVLQQQFTDYELIVVDDGSTDRSAQLVEACLSASGLTGRCHLIRQTNSGVSVARNIGAAMAQGEYVTFLDGDDWWEPSFLTEMDGLIQRYPQAGLYGTGYYIQKHGVRRVAPTGVDSKFTDGIIDYCSVYARTLCMPLHVDTIALRHDLFLATGGFPKGITLGEDFMLWIKLALAHPVAYLNRPLVTYNQDVDAAHRAIGRLHDPSTHFLWNIDFLAEEERSNADMKRLLDGLRLYSLWPYHLSRQYHAAAQAELEKVDWSRQPASVRRRYRMPLPIARLLYRIKRAGAHLKKQLKRKI